MAGALIQTVRWTRRANIRSDGPLALPAVQPPVPADIVATRSRVTADPWVGLALLTASLLVRFWVYRNIATDGAEPTLVLAGWSVVVALFPAGNVGAALLVMQAAVVAAGVSLAVRTRGFSELDADAALGGSALYLAGVATVVPVALLVLVVIVNLLLLLLLGLAVLLFLRVLVAVLGG